MKIFLVYIVGWLGLVVLAIVNGVVRERTYGKILRERSAHQLSTLTGIILFGIYIWSLVGIWRMESPGQALVIGGLWLVMTVSFEFIFGHFVMGHPWHKLLHDYNLMKGRVWILVLFWTVLAPYLFYPLRP